ncbi:hypothetical protein NPIL_213981 [Nephila pilipes]|uniref:Uncharacterized protein n=1 Tax=Nephila pilipes TaxID=299642 RepID=A0A8X6P7B6_NEPPI|nr:hypothetical protein NPIL_213981 [Nephila pilipes]
MPKPAAAIAIGKHTSPLPSHLASFWVHWCVAYTCLYINMCCFDSFFFILLGRPLSVLLVARHGIVPKEIATVAPRDSEEVRKGDGLDKGEYNFSLFVLYRLIVNE